MKRLSSIEPGSKGATQGAPARLAERFVGIDLGAETLKLVEVRRNTAGIRLGRFEIVEHAKKTWRGPPSGFSQLGLAHYQGRGGDRSV